MLRQHHGGGLQRLDVVVGVFARRLVLDREHAQHVAAAQDRHGEEGVVDLLARFRPIGESRVVLRLRLIDRHSELGAAPDQTFAPLHECVVHRRRIEPLGCEQLEAAVLAPQIDGAHLGHHQAGDLAHDLVEPALAVAGLGHDLAQAPQHGPQGRLGRSNARVLCGSLGHKSLSAAALPVPAPRARGRGRRVA